MTPGLQFVLNGRPVRLADCPTNLTLLEYLRRSGLTGSKEGCAEGDCGACSAALLDRDASGRPAYRAFNSCLVPLCLLDGREIVTVEGLADNRGLHPVQKKMVENHGSQCGYCTPGFVVSLFEGFYRDDVCTRAKIEDQLCGNLCRCTGYRPILDAAVEAFHERGRAGDSFAERLRQPLIAPRAVTYDFDGEKFLRPVTLDQLLCLRRQFPQARLIAGATEIGLEITKQFKRVPLLISVEAVPELKEISRTDSEWRIGAAATLTDIEDTVAPEFPALADMLRVFGSRQIRNRATMGGNIATASPIGDSAPVLLALDAKVILAGVDGERTLPIDQFFLGYRKTALQPGEVMKTILLPRGPSAPGLERKCAWFKVSKRREMDISTVAACFTVDLDGEGIVRHARMAYGGVAAMSSRARGAEQALLGQPWNAQTIQGVLPLLRAEFAPISDVRGSSSYRNGMVAALLEKFFAPPKASDEALPLKASPRAGPHESAHLHVSGGAQYADDQSANKSALEVWPICSCHAKARILKRDADAARQMPGIHAVLLAEDIPGLNDVGAVNKDEILLADKEVSFHGQLIGLVVGESQEACRAAAAKVVVEYEPLPPVLILREAIEGGSFHNEPNFIRRGAADQALAQSPLTLEGEFELGGQEHFYLEMQAAWAEPEENGALRVVSSTQHPSEVLHIIAHLLKLPIHQVVVQVPRMGGGFGGKETQAATPAALAALAAWKTGRRVRIHWNRDQDMMMTGHRHPFLARFKVGFDSDGLLKAARIHIWSNGGWSRDLSQAVTDRALFHLDNSYYIPAVEFRGQVAKTNLSSNTAFRGFGGPQGMLIIEEIIDRVARHTGLRPEVVRERNLYRGNGESNTTHYGQPVGDNRLEIIWRELNESSQVEKRRDEIAAWNAGHPHAKRGLGMTPLKFGISFTVTHLNQAGAFVLIYQDGTVQVNHSATEMGQGVHTNIRAIAARELGIDPSAVRIMPTSTDKVPNTSATAASVGTDINGAAVKNACEILRERLRPFADGVDFAETVRRAYLARVSLSATGFYATPDIHWDRVAGRGKPFHYFACGAAVVEVEVDGFTGMQRVLRADILHDAGSPINEGISRGQVEGGFIQGMGWLTSEELKWDDRGRLLTHSPDTYKIPSIGDTPRIFNVTLLKDAAQNEVVYGSKAVGEPPFMLAIAVREAIRDAVASFGPAGGQIPLAVPATCEAIWTAIQQRTKT